MDIVGYIGIYGALIATVGAAWQIRAWVLDRPRLKIGAAFAIGGAYPPLDMVSVSIANIGQRPVTVHEVGFVLPDKRSIAYTNRLTEIGSIELPYRLEMFDERSAYFEQTPLLKSLAEAGGSMPVSCYVRIGGGRKFASDIDAAMFKSWFKVFRDSKQPK